jgi:hypothetical protein
MRHTGILFLTIFFSCSGKLPDDVLPPERMQTVLWDVLRADEMAGYYASQDSSLQTLNTYTGYYQHILNIHNISKEEFRTSLKYYQNNPVLFKVVLDSLQSFAERQQKKADSSTWMRPSGPQVIRQSTPMSIDSLKKIKLQ